MIPVKAHSGFGRILSIAAIVGAICYRYIKTSLSLLAQRYQISPIYVTAKGNYLKIVNSTDQSSVQLQGGIGRSFARMNDGKLLFVQKSNQNWTLKTLDPVNYATETVIETLPLSEDFALLSDGTVLMGSGSRLYRYKIGDPQKQWADVADLSKFGIFNIKRLAVSRETDKIAIVNDVYQK